MDLCLVFDGRIKRFTMNCLLNGNTADIVVEHWERAGSIAEFKKNVFRDIRLKHTQGYAELSKESEGHWYRIREMFGDSCFEVYCDGGGVKIISAMGNCEVRVGKSCGDGVVRCAIFENKDSFNNCMMDYTGVVLKGRMKIEECDWGVEFARELDGKYLVYTWQGLMAFVKFD